MGTGSRLLFGPLATAILAAGVIGLAFMVPGYSPVHQTVSEIGEVGSPARIPFAVLLCAVSLCLLVFASGVRHVALSSRRSPAAAYLIACMAVSAGGVGLFAFPHPLHNVFGMSEMIGYQAPLAMALTWRRDAQGRPLAIFSWVCFALVWLTIALNLSSLDRHGALWAALNPFYGLVQRSLFLAWFAWAAGAGLMLFRRQRDVLAGR
jgi:hypothetical protein